jgi:hypothetical protein
MTVTVTILTRQQTRDKLCVDLKSRLADDRRKKKVVGRALQLLTVPLLARIREPLDWVTSLRLPSS